VPLVLLKDFGGTSLSILFYILANVAITLLSIVELALLLRAILSIFMLEGGLTVVVDMLTEPFLRPVRALFVKLNIFQGTPFDFSGLFVMVIISILIAILA
jgi:uncharacterized protein YggT (Ycf19 family)